MTTITMLCVLALTGAVGAYWQAKKITRLECTIAVHEKILFHIISTCPENRLDKALDEIIKELKGKG